MATLQEGNFVTMDSKGNRKSVPMSQKPSSEPKRAKRPPPTIGGINPANSASKEAAGMKKGGGVKMKKGGKCR